MKKVILFGATGHLGRAIASELEKQGYSITAVVRNEARAQLLNGITARFVTAGVCSRETLTGICAGQDIVVSALGKSVSPNDKSRSGFRQVDLNGNTGILEEAKKSGVKKFVYVSALHAEKYPHLEYFKAHHEFSERLKQSGIDYSIIKPPAIFSAFTDVIDLAKKGRLATIGRGDKKANPIYEGDLAAVCVQAIDRPNSETEAGGPRIYTRKQLNEIMQQAANAGKKVKTVPVWLAKLMLPAIRIFNKNMYDKFAFFTEVMLHDTIAPQTGAMTFEEYIQRKISSR